MKIAMIASGVWNSIHMDFARALVRGGHEVRFYTEDARAGSGMRFLRMREDGIDFFVISDVRRNPFAWLPDKLLKYWLGRRFFTTLIAVWRFLRASRDCELTLVEGDWMGFFVALACIAGPRRWVVGIHDLLYLRNAASYPGRPRSAWRERVKLWVLHKAWRIRANSWVTRDALVQGGVDASRIFVVPLQLPWWMLSQEIRDATGLRAGARAEIRTGHGVAEREALLITMCRLDPVKGLEVAIEALALLAGEGRAVRLMICGGDREFPGLGSYEAHLRRLAQRLDVSDRVVFTGNIEIHRVRRYLAAADLHLAPSVVDTFNYAAAEAALVGTYSLCSPRVGSGPWIAEAGAGEVLPDREPATWARRIAQLLDQPLSGPGLAAAARAVETELSADRVARQFMEALARE